MYRTEIENLLLKEMVIHDRLESVMDDAEDSLIPETNPSIFDDSNIPMDDSIIGNDIDAESIF